MLLKVIAVWVLVFHVTFCWDVPLYASCINVVDADRLQCQWSRWSRKSIMCDSRQHATSWSVTYLTFPVIWKCCCYISFLLTDVSKIILLSVIQSCFIVGAVDACLKYKLKKQSLGLFNNASSTTVLLHKVAKTLDDAKETSKTVAEMESQNDPLSRWKSLLFQPCCLITRIVMLRSDNVTWHGYQFLSWVIPCLLLLKIECMFNYNPIFVTVVMIVYLGLGGLELIVFLSLNMSCP